MKSIILSIILGLLLCGAFIFIGIHLTIFNSGLIVFFSSEEGLSVVRYLQGVAPLPFMSERETIHMKDVYNILNVLYIVGVWCYIFSVLFIGFFLFQKEKLAIVKGINWCRGIIGFGGLFLIFCMIFFDKAFILMHKVLFSNDFWILPSSSFLIRTFPTTFFQFMGFAILFYWIAVFFVLQIAKRWLYAHNI